MLLSCAKQCDQIWRNFANVGIIIKPFGPLWGLGKFLAKYEPNLLTFWQILKYIEQILIALIAKYCTKDLAIWSHWRQMKIIDYWIVFTGRIICRAVSTQQSEATQLCESFNGKTTSSKSRAWKEHRKLKILDEPSDNQNQNLSSIILVACKKVKV